MRKPIQTILPDGGIRLEIQSHKYIEYRDSEGRFHREGAPARIWTDRTYCEWFWHGECHREDGPAIDGRYDVDDYGYVKSPIWFWHGKRIDCETNEEFLKLMKMKAFW